MFKRISLNLFFVFLIIFFVNSVSGYSCTSIEENSFWESSCSISRGDSSEGPIFLDYLSEKSAVFRIYDEDSGNFFRTNSLREGEFFVFEIGGEAGILEVDKIYFEKNSPENSFVHFFLADLGDLGKDYSKCFLEEEISRCFLFEGDSHGDSPIYLSSIKEDSVTLHYFDVFEKKFKTIPRVSEGDSFFLPFDGVLYNVTFEEFKPYQNPSYSYASLIHEELCEGDCFFENSCYKEGDVLKDLYCSKEEGFLNQKDSGEFCGKDYECSSLVCSSEGVCKSSGFFAKIVEWFKGLF